MEETPEKPNRTEQLLELISLQLSLAAMKQDEVKDEVKDDSLTRLVMRIQHRQDSLGLLRETQLGAKTEIDFFTETGTIPQFKELSFRQKLIEDAWQRDEVLNAVHDATRQQKSAYIQVTIDALGTGIARVRHELMKVRH
jgi:hypothetical protein